MFNRAFLLAALMFLFATDAGAQSRQAPQQHDEIVADANSNRGTAEEPLVVDLIPAPDAAQRAQNDQSDRNRNFWGTVFIAIFTFAQLILAGVAIFTSRAQLRAYLLSDEPVWVVRPAGDGEGNYIIQFGVKIKNYGQTPAFDVTMAFAGEVRASEEKLPDFASLPAIEDRGAKTIVGPGGFIMVPGFSQTATHGAYQQIQKAVQRAYVWAIIDYKDAFGVKRRTTVNLRTERYHREDFWPCSPCKEGNNAT